MLKSENGDTILADNYSESLGFGRLENTTSSLSKVETLTMEIFNKVFEVWGCLNLIRDVNTVSIKKRQDETSFQHKCRMIQIRYEFFLHEYYVLEQRLLTLVNYIHNSYKKDKSIKSIEIVKLTVELKDYILNSMAPVRKLRKTHVHLYTLQSDELAQLQSLAYHISSEKDPEFKRHLTKQASAQYKKLQQGYSSGAKKTMSGLEKIVDNVLCEIHSYLFNKKGAL